MSILLNLPLYNKKVTKSNNKATTLSAKHSRPINIGHVFSRSHNYWMGMHINRYGELLMLCIIKYLSYMTKFTHFIKPYSPPHLNKISNAPLCLAPCYTPPSPTTFGNAVQPILSIIPQHLWIVGVFFLFFFCQHLLYNMMYL